MSASLAVCSLRCLSLRCALCVCVGLYFCYHHLWLWITFTMHQLITNYCLVVILISLMMLHRDHHQRGSISLTPRSTAIFDCQLRILLKKGLFRDF